MPEDSVIESIVGTTIKVRNLDGGYKTFDVMDLFSIDENDLTREFMSQAALYGYFAALATEAERIAELADFDKEQAYALLDTDTRKTMERNGAKSTEGQIKSIIMASTGYTKAVQREIKCRFDHKLLKAIVAAMDVRSNMLISLGSHLRHEMSMTGMNIGSNDSNHTVDAGKTVRDIIRSRKNLERH